MARKKSNDEQGVSMDSLMDALTNVVAVLIVILILLQVDVGQTVERMLNELKPASPEQIQEAQQKQQDVLEQIRKQEQLLKAPVPTPQEISSIKADLLLLDESLKNHSASLLDLAALKKKIEEQKLLEAQELKKTEVVLAEIARMKALLDKTPLPKAPEATVVKIPGSKEIPESAQIYYCYIFADQAHLVDAVQGKKMIMDEMKKNDREFLREVKKHSKNPDVRIYDQEKIVSYFASKDFKIRHHSVTVPYNKPWTFLNMRINFDIKQGDATLADMEEPKGRFSNMCKYVRSIPRSVLIFKVHSNGFATYLKAREIADSFNIPCGWEFNFNNHHSERLDFKVNNLEEPPKPTGPPSKGGLKRKLD